MKEEILSALENIRDKKGLIYLATILGHQNTSRVQNWLRQGEVPESQKQGIRAILKLKGELK